MTDNMLTFSEALARLGRRAYGGSEVAAAPGDDDDPMFVDGPMIAGADSAASWFVSRVGPRGGGTCPILVLLGAPGNGKSHLSRTIVSRLGLDGGPREGLHERTYRYLNPHRPESHIVIVNDASIPSGDFGADGDLIAEINQAIEMQAPMVINVNRGILYQELASSGDDSIGRAVIKWLESGVPQAVQAAAIEHTAGSDHHSLISGRIVGQKGEVLAECCVVRMDSCSLLEAIPEIMPGEGNGPPRAVGHVLPREFGRQAHERSIEFSDATAAGVLLKQFVEGFPPRQEDSGSASPFEANRSSLLSSTVRQGVLSVLRAGEIASSRRFTYRELWGAIALMIVGDDRARGTGERKTPTAWYDQQFVGNNAGTELQRYLTLSAVRLHQSLFGANEVEHGKIVESRRMGTARYDSPVIEITQAVDPSFDALDSSSRDWSWPRKLHDVFYGRSTGTSILNSLMEALGPGNLLEPYVAEFDWVLDRVVVSAIDGDDQRGLDDRSRRELVSWYSVYLRRMCAVCHGEPAFSAELAMWVMACKQASQNGSLPASLENGLLTLLLPYYLGRGDSRERLLPLYDSRSEPVTHAPDQAKLVLRLSNDVRLSSRLVGDQLLVDLSTGSSINKSRVTLEVDFSLLREALTCASNLAGTTENGARSVPRIERFRSGLVGLEPRPLYVVVGRDMYETLSVAQAERSSL